VFSGVTLIANLVTGIVVARGLGPDGRGVTIALVTVAQLAGFLFSGGAAQSLSYFIARRPADGPRLLTTWTLMLVPLAAVAIAITELLLPTIFSTDGDQAIEIGRWFMFIIVIVIGLELNYGLLLGTGDFFAYNLLRMTPMVLAALTLVGLWALDELTVRSTLIGTNLAYLLVLAIGMVRSVRRIGFGPVDLPFGLSSLWFGVRGQGSTVASNVTARLDVAMLPAYVTAGQVGLYSVATNISLIVYQLSNTFAGLVIPAAASDTERSRIKVIGSLWASLALAAVLAIGLAVLARPLLGLVYGDRFRAAADPLLLLLPGSVLFAGSAILGAGVYAAGRPFTATFAQLVGMVVTVAGLFAFLDTGGITAAALVSTAFYATVFFAMLVAYQRVTATPWREFLPSPRRVRELTR
jgi:O-antigen/teichoic acid export membrane protein